MAIAEKRSLGSWTLWIGVLLIPALGIVVVPRSKLLRAARAIDALLASGLEFHEYRSLCGLLEHLRAVNLRGRNVMHGLYVPHGPDGASRDGPSGWVTCDLLMRKQLERWNRLIWNSGGTSVRAALEREELDRWPGHGGAARIAADCAKQGGPALKSAIPSETRPRVCSSSVSGLVKTSAGFSVPLTLWSCSLPARTTSWSHR